VLEPVQLQAGVVALTMNDRRRPPLRSSEAQTTIRSARSPEVTKIFAVEDVLSPSTSAVVRIASVRAGFRLGDYRRPLAAVVLSCLSRHRGDRGVAEAPARIETAG
jgi:hypothetical protein